MIPKSFLEHVLYSTVRIQLIDDNGNPNGIGTGFLVGVELDKSNLSFVLLISNKHVFKNCPKYLVNYHKKKNGKNEPDLGSIFPHLALGYEDAYSEHPNPKIDLACVNISEVLSKYSNDIFYRVLDTDSFCDFTEPYLDVANRIIFVGYPDNRFDEKHNLPIVRTGTIASHPKVDFNKIPQFLKTHRYFLVRAVVLFSLILMMQGSLKARSFLKPENLIIN